MGRMKGKRLLYLLCQLMLKVRYFPEYVFLMLDRLLNNVGWVYLLYDVLRQPRFTRTINFYFYCFFWKHASNVFWGSLLIQPYLLPLQTIASLCTTLGVPAFTAFRISCVCAVKPVPTSTQSPRRCCSALTSKPQWLLFSLQCFVSFVWKNEVTVFKS